MHPPAASPGPPRGRARRGARGRASTRRSARGRPRRRRSPRALVLGLQNARARRRRPRRAWMSPAPGARRGDPGRYPDRSLRRGRGGPRCARRPRPRDTPPSEPADDERRRRRRGTASRPIRPCVLLTRGFRGPVPPATGAPDRRRGRRRPRATIAARRVGAARAAARSSPRCWRTGAAPRASRTHPRAAPVPARAAAPAGRADSRASRRRSAPAPAHRAGPARWIPTALARRDAPGARREAPGTRRARRVAHAPRTRARPSPPTGGERRTRARAPTHDRATAHHRPRRAAAAPRRPRTAGRGRPARPGTGSAPALR